MKIVLTGGGTAGHVNPAVAIAEKVMEREPASEITFVGRRGGKENRSAENFGLKIKTLEVRGFQRRLFGGHIKTLIMALKAKKEAEKILSECGAEVVVGTGGYVCWPVLKAAKKLGIPTLIHESNAMPGLVTRALASDSAAVLLGYDGAAKHLPKKCRTLTVGNPPRKEFTLISRQKARKRLGLTDEDILIVSFGGSGGAARLNDAVIEFMKEVSVGTRSIRHLHATGERFYREVEEEELRRGTHGCRILPYIENMPVVLSAADIAITRAGALTLAELQCAAVASILVPSPNVTANHQLENARAISNKGGAIVIEEGTGLGEALKTEITELICNVQKRKGLSEAIKKFYRPDSADEIYKEIREIAKRRKKG